MNRNPVNGSENGVKGRAFAGKKGDDTGQKDKTGKKGGKGGAVLGEINDDPKKKKPK